MPEDGASGRKARKPRPIELSKTPAPAQVPTGGPEENFAGTSPRLICCSPPFSHISGIKPTLLITKSCLLNRHSHTTDPTALPLGWGAPRTAARPPGASLHSPAPRFHMGFNHSKHPRGWISPGTVGKPAWKGILARVVLHNQAQGKAQRRAGESTKAQGSGANPLSTGHWRRSSSMRSLRALQAGSCSSCTAVPASRDR